MIPNCEHGGSFSLIWAFSSYFTSYNKINRISGYKAKAKMNFKLQISTYSVCSAHQLLPVIKVVVGTYCVDAMFFVFCCGLHLKMTFHPFFHPYQTSVLSVIMQRMFSTTTSSDESHSSLP